jgi:hypothetical protein
LGTIKHADTRKVEALNALDVANTTSSPKTLHTSDHICFFSQVEVSSKVFG